MLHVETSIKIDVAPSVLKNYYLAYNNWRRLFPSTIKAAKLLKQQKGILVIEVEHKKAGRVINILTLLPAEEIKLEEFKPAYDATFINRFQAFEEGTKFTVSADIFLKGFYKIASPFAKPLIKSRLRKFVLEPMKQFAEKA